MDTPDLIRMSRQIADFFRAWPEDRAAAEVARHMESFWDPRMRRRLLDHIAEGGSGVDPLVRAAARHLRPVPGADG